MRQPTSADSIRKQYLYPLLNMGIINSFKSVINKSENLYSPVEDSIFSIFDNDNDLRLKIMDTSFYPDRYPSKNVLEEQFRVIVKHDAKWGGKNDENFQRYKIQDTDGSELTVEQLIDKYLSDPETCFIRI